MVCYYLRFRFERQYMAAFIRTARSPRVAMATSSEWMLQDRKGQKMSHETAELVGRGLAERMKQLSIHRAKFDMKRELAENSKYHDYISTIAVALSQNGIILY